MELDEFKLLKLMWDKFSNKPIGTTTLEEVRKEYIENYRDEQFELIIDKLIKDNYIMVEDGKIEITPIGGIKYDEEVQLKQGYKTDIDVSPTPKMLIDKSVHFHGNVERSNVAHSQDLRDEARINIPTENIDSPQINNPIPKPTKNVLGNILAFIGIIIAIIGLIMLYYGCHH